MIGGEEKGLCNRPACKNRHAKNRRVCYKHLMRAWRRRNPMRAAFFTLRDHAKARGIPFSISFHAFRRFALQSDYLNRVGNGAHCLTVDRINNLKGYTARNVQALTRAENTIKQAKVDKIRMEKGYAWQQ